MIWSGHKCYLLVAGRKCYLLFLKILIINSYNLQLKKKEKEKIRKERKRKILKTHHNFDNSDDDIIGTVKIILTR
jgi:hypothetical protein